MIIPQLEAAGVQDEGGAPVRLVVAGNISERKQGEAGREQLLSAIEQGGNTVLITDFFILSN